ncbi:MAG: glycoside hydrolase family 75 protein, partial [Terrimicrobiaceae bacterium]|nr:glycoside hydrolase family 75 protein [Terrimicrobiaceae bacterium]
ISEAFDQLYENKAGWIRERLSRLDQLLTRHNYYDCETILEFEAPGTGRRMLLMKGDMDVNVDGSDGDRNIEVDGSSRFFQPQTSYRWRKRTARPNPFLEAAEKKLKDLKDEYAIKGLPAERNAELREGIQETSRRIYDLKTWSFLVSAADPNIVVPGFMLRGGEGRRAHVAIGDYAAVIYEGRAYPAVVGDAGPSFKFGEASLRICREINPKSSSMARPVSQLNAAYVVFPGTADEPAPPDLKLWRERCSALLAEVGLGALPVHEWEDIVPPWPAEPVAPAGSPAPDASPSPAAENPGGEQSAAAEPPPQPPAPALESPPAPAAP